MTFRTSSGSRSVTADEATGGRPARPAFAAGPVDPDAALVALGVEWERIQKARYAAAVRLDECHEAAEDAYPDMPLHLIADHRAQGLDRLISEEGIDQIEKSMRWSERTSGEKAEAARISANRYRADRAVYLIRIEELEAIHGVPQASAALDRLDILSGDIEAEIINHPVAGVMGLRVKLKLLARYMPPSPVHTFTGKLFAAIMSDADRCCASPASAIVAA